MRASLILVTVALSAATATCMGRDPATEATVTSASQGANVTGTGATGGSTPETDMLGTGRASAPVTTPRTAASIVAPPIVVPPPTIEPMASDAGPPVEPPSDR